MERKACLLVRPLGEEGHSVRPVHPPSRPRHMHSKLPSSEATLQKMFLFLWPWASLPLRCIECSLSEPSWPFIPINPHRQPTQAPLLLWLLFSSTHAVLTVRGWPEDAHGASCVLCVRASFSWLHIVLPFRTSSILTDSQNTIPGALPLSSHKSAWFGITVT